MPERRRVNQVQPSLQTMLRLRGPKEQELPEIIVSAAPQVWMDADFENSILVDVGRLLGASGPWSSGAGRQLSSQLEVLVLQQLLNAGWPQELAVCEYRPDAKSGVRFDIALLDEQQQLVAAVKVEGLTTRLQGIPPAGIAEGLFARASVPHVIVTDGDQYHVFGVDGATEVFSSAPSPSTLGIAVADTRSSQRPTTTLRPENVGVLQAIMDEHAPRRVVVDFTLPWGHRLDQEDSLRELVPPECLSNARGPVESLHLILAWAASRDYVDTLSTVAPPALSWSAGLSWLRDYLTQHIGLAAHIELPPGTFAPATQIKASYLRFQKKQIETYFDFLATVGDLIEIEDKPWFRSFSDWLAGTQPSQGFTRPVSDVESWAISHNDPEAAAVRERLEEFGASSTLGELVDARVGSHIARDQRVSTLEEGEVRLVDARRLRAGLSNDDSSEDAFVASNVSLNENDYLRDGDVLMPRMLTPSSQAVVFSADYPAVAATSVLVLRPREGTSSLFVAEYLNSASGRRLLESVAGGPHVPQISVSTVRQIPVPKIDCDIEKPLTGVDDACESITAVVDDLESRRSALFDSVNLNQFLANLGELQRKSSLLTDAIRLANSLNFQISQLFPFPFAYSYRLLAGCVDARELLQQQLRVAENILAFLGSVSLALLSDDDRRQVGANIRSFWSGGISPGDWKDIIRRCSAFFGEYEDNPLAASIHSLNAGSEKRGFGKELHFLVRTKNDCKHDRGPTVEADVRTVSGQLQKSLDSCMASLTFWTRHPIRQVGQLDAERQQPGRVRLQCLRITGDHPGFQQEEIRWHEPMKRRDLFVEVHDRYWIPLYPFVQTVTCSLCKTDEIHFVDKWDGKKKATLKSFERGHSSESSETAENLSVGMPASEGD